MAVLTHPVTERAEANPTRDEVLSQLEKILASPQFRNSRRCQSLLRYVVEAVCDDKHDVLKERVIGTAVFARDPGYDTNQDAVVRNAAAEVRKRLAQYYLDSGSESAIRIELSPGSYHPEFHPLPSNPVPPAALAPAATGRSWLTIALAGAALISSAGWLWEASRNRPSSTELDEFWQPTLNAPGPVQICIGQSSLSYLPRKLEDLSVPLTKELLAPMRDRFFYYGDTLCMGRLAEYLGSHKKSFQVRGAKATTYSELRGKAVVLVGAFNNDWTQRLTSGGRFTLANDGENVRGVRDRDHGPDLVWSIQGGSQGWIAEDDYAIVTRVFDADTEHAVLSAGGIGHYGTMAAGDFISSPMYFREVLKTAPADWSRKNIQIVLHTRIAQGTPGPPRVVATYFW